MNIEHSEQKPSRGELVANISTARRALTVLEENELIDLALYCGYQEIIPRFPGIIPMALSRDTRRAAILATIADLEKQLKDMDSKGR